MGCIKLSILDEQYKTELKVSSPQKELTSDFSAESACSYSLFGQIISEYRSDWMMDTLPRYLFTSAERDQESVMYYMSARYYSSDGGTFISRDPLFEKNFWISSYSYCKNSPINRVDPDGKDDYEVNRKTGAITLLKETGEETHRLVAQNKKGEIKTNKDGTYKNSITVEKGVIDNMTKDGDKQQLDFGAGKDAENKAISVFNFLSDNSNVEWGAVGYGKGENNQNSVATSGIFDKEGNAAGIARNNSADGNLNYYYHSHSLDPGSNLFPSGQDKNLWNELWNNDKSPDAVMGIRYWSTTQRYKKSDNRNGYCPIITR